MVTGYWQPSEPRLSLLEKLRMLNWGFVMLIVMIGAIGVALLYSAGGLSWEPWASRQLIRFIAGMGVMLVLAMIDVRFWLKVAYLGYAVGLVMLVAVEIMGQVGMGAQRWIDLGVIVIQPSELMKIALVLALARYFHTRTTEEIHRPVVLIPPILMVLLPVALVLLQPNLGTAMLLLLGSAALFFAAGVRLWKFVVVSLAGLAMLPIGWQFLHDYQKQRVLTFLNPGSDPLGAGYNILQSQIALGSGGMFGKGFGLGTQSQLMFLPEKHTDFIFVVLAEEMGMAGAMLLLALYAMVLAYGFVIALSARNQFGRLVAVGLTFAFFLYLFVNVAMVTGLIPVVGIPLPLVSYGGTAMLTLLIGCGILLSVSVHRDTRIPRRIHD
ncbi:rod shape-determining protein RodA [Inquilinus sp. CAU 1745]|uniref:rod shape-determining protein RodA n=1 Tax=Inquilinus sp. CAU 1745 TaxID=3140369 RepID=UPI00325BEB2C